MDLSRPPTAALAPFTVALLAACYQPAPALGLPCSDAMQCPSGQRCVVGRSDGPRCQDESFTPDEVERPAHDLPEGALDISRGGNFSFDLEDARDDVVSSCAVGRPELFFRLVLPTAQVVYLDTFGSRFDTAVAVRGGSCAALGVETACVDDSCGGAQSQGAWNLAAGEHCVVIEGKDGSGGDGGGLGDPHGQLTVTLGKRAGDPLPLQSGTVQGDTCQDDNSNDGDSCGCEPAEDHHYFFTTCPDTVVTARFETCDGANWDTVLQLRGNDDGDLACNDDACGSLASSITREVSAGRLFWAIVDGCQECGPYTLKYDLTTAPLR